MQRFADETTLHGVKEVWYASRLGRVFWLVVFSVCVVFMAIQVKGVFKNYLSESVGTKTTYISKGNKVEVPSIFYCSARWKSHPDTLSDLIQCAKKFGREMEKLSPSLSLVEQQTKFRAECYAKFVHASLSEEIINTIINPDWIENMYAEHFLSPKPCPDGYVKEMAKLAEANPDLYEKLTHYETVVYEHQMQALGDHLDNTNANIGKTINVANQKMKDTLDETAEELGKAVDNTKEQLQNSIQGVKNMANVATDLAVEALADGLSKISDAEEKLKNSINDVIETASQTKETLSNSISALGNVGEQADNLANTAKMEAAAAVTEAFKDAQQLITEFDLAGKIADRTSPLKTKISSLQGTANGAKSTADRASSIVDNFRKRKRKESGFLCDQNELMKCKLSTGKYVNISTIGLGDRKKRETEMLNDFAVHQMHAWILELLEDIENKFNGSLKSYVEANSATTGGGMREPAHGVVTNRLGLSLTASVDQKVDIDNQREGKVSVNLNGVCWDVNPEAEPQTVQEAQMNKYSHYVIHLGAFAHDISVLAKETKTEGKEAKDFNFNLEEAIYFTTKEHPRASCDGTFRRPYETDMFISTQSTPVPFFSNRIRLSGSTPSAYVKFSTKTIRKVNRKGYRCKKNWTILDKAHCIEEKRSKEKHGPNCRQYLPASRHYPETPITNQTCYHAPMNKIKNILKQYPSNDYQAIEFFEQMKTLNAKEDTTVDWMKRYSVNDNDCPTPCSETEYIIAITYSSSDDGVCNEVLGHVLLKEKYDNLKHEVNATAKKKQRELEKFVKLDRKWSDPPRPCTKVTVLQTEESGFVSEEYLLYTIADLASNLGGTFGLWMGASVISFVQCIYFVCLERMLTAKRAPTIEAKVGGTTDI